MSLTDLYAILLIAIGLSMDCFAVALSISTCSRRFSFTHFLRVPLAFGIFQAGMNLLGWLAGQTVSRFIAPFDHWVAFGLLVFVGLHMLYQAWRGEENEKRLDITNWWLLLALAIATSLDSLAVGLSFAFLHYNIWFAALIIGLAAFAISSLGFIVGRKVGDIIGRWAEIAGGFVLILIGIRILLSHLLG
jgi:manganese efflux pump family protein